MTDSPIVQRVKQKIRDISSQSGETFNYLFNRLTLERFIVRIQNSSYKNNLIFKGGLCLSNFIDLGRQTKDVDFLVKNIKGEKEEFYKIFSNISSITIEDGFVFEKVEVGELSIENKKYAGNRINVSYTFGNARGKIQIDTGIGDTVRPCLMDFQMLRDKKGTIFGDSI